MKDFLLFTKKKILQTLNLKNEVLSIGFFAYLFIGLVLLNGIVGQEITHLAVHTNPYPSIKNSQYPLIERKYFPQITAQAAYVLDDTSKVVLFAKNENVRFSPASTTKIMTALTGLDYFSLNQPLTIQRSNVEPVVVGFPKGVRVTFLNLLYSMFLPSGNDAAFAIGDNYPGGESAFVVKMNEKAKLLHLTNTQYGDPVGLLDDQDYTTAHDLALLASFAISHPLLAQIVDTKTKVISDSAGNIYTLENINKLLGKYGVNGLKTGYTEEAGEVLVTSTVLQKHTFIIVVMKSDDRFADTEKLLQMIQDNVSYIQINP